MGRVVNLYMESNPNPNSLKFVVNFPIVPEGGSFDFPDLKSASDAPLAKALFEFPFVRRVFFMNNFITVTKDENVEWIEIQDQIRYFIQQYLQDEKPVIRDILSSPQDTEPSETGGSNENPEVVDKIKTVLEDYVKPAVEMDGGAITFDSYNSGKLTVQLQGACSGCPSSIVTLKAGIENLMKRMVPEVREVEALEA